MLRRLEIEGSWRSLSAGFWQSTLAELLLSMADGVADVDAVWETDEGQPGPAPHGNPTQDIPSR